MSDKRLIEVAFPLKQTSIASVHEKNVRHGHISTLHIWPARRPLAACRAVLLATLLPDPGTDSERQALINRIGGRVIEGTSTPISVEDGEDAAVLKEDVIDGVLKWKNENNADMDWFRAEIKKAYGGRAPKVLDPFAGGGAIPLEAMRLGCEATAMDINPVAWFILKCTLEYPQKLAGQKLLLPDFVKRDKGFMTDYLRSLGFEKNALQAQLAALNLVESKQGNFATSAVSMEADLAWHVRAWGLWVLQAARRELARFYPTYAEFVPLKGKGTKANSVKEESNSFTLLGNSIKLFDSDSANSVKLFDSDSGLRLVPLNEDGTLNMAALNGEFTKDYLDSPLNPRWVAKPTVAYLWARTVQCKRCRATIPLLKTRWLCKKAKKRVVLTMTPNEAKTGVIFGVVANPPKEETGDGTMSGSGSTCPGCGAIMTMQDMRLEAQAGKLGTVLTAVVVDGVNDKEYRLPTEHEIEMAGQAEAELERVYAEIPFGLPDEPTPKTGTGASRAFSVQGYGLMKLRDLFTARQLLALGTFVKHTRALNQNNNMTGYSVEWREAISAYLALVIDKQADYGSAICMWHNGAEKLAHTFTRFALPIAWDYCEVNGFSGLTGDFAGALAWVARVIEENSRFAHHSPSAQVIKNSAMQIVTEQLDVILTDPPYYDAIPYSDLMDFFYVWLRRTLYGLSPEMDKVFVDSLAPKWNHEQNDGELIDDPMRFEGDRVKSKQNYEDGMFKAFQGCYQALQPEGRLVVVFANKQPEAWETLVSAVVRAGFVVTGSWPIQTEMATRMRAKSSAALASSIWLVCKKRDRRAKPGWDNLVLAEMQGNITKQLHRFWDAGIRGPDFVWAATGPAMEAFSQYPVVRKAKAEGFLTIADFLRQVRRMVVNFVVGRVLHTEGESETTQLDELTTYYLLHRNDFGMEEAPSGACILYALTCNLSDRELSDKYDLVEHKGSTLKLVAWDKRKLKDEAKKLKTVSSQTEMDLVTPTVSLTVTLIDQIHVLMNLWKGGDVAPVDRYLQQQGLLRLPLFQQVLQAIIELAAVGSDERSIAESLSNHVKKQGGAVQMRY